MVDVPVPASLLVGCTGQAAALLLLATALPVVAGRDLAARRRHSLSAETPGAA